MKRLILLLAVMVFATGAFAQAADRDVLVTPDGTVFTVETTARKDGSSFLQLTRQDGDEKTTLTVPDSTSPGTHEHPALAYDTETKTLFTLWLHMPNMMSSELLLAPFSDGKWQPAFSIDNQPFHIRYNLRINITQRVSALQTDGTYKDVPALLLHLLWWEATGKGEEARYALLDIEQGKVTSTEVHSLSEFAPVSTEATTAGPDFNPEILRHPGFLETSSSNSVDVLTGDVKSLTFQRTTIRPVLETRIRIPVGRSPGTRVPVPSDFSADWSGGKINVVSSPRSSDIVLAHPGTKALSYISLAGGHWSSVRSIDTEKISIDTAMGALSKMVNAAQ